MNMSEKLNLGMEYSLFYVRGSKKLPTQATTAMVVDSVYWPGQKNNLQKT
jgi:hypothetical protein